MRDSIRIGCGILLAAVLTLTPTTLADAPACVTPPSGLVSWWTGDGNVMDFVGPHNGTLQGDAGFAAGYVDQAFTFDGAGDYVQVGNPVVSTPPYTADAWVNATTNDPSVNKYIVANGGQTSSGVGLSLILLDSGNWAFFVRAANGTGGNAQAPANVAGWNHVAGTWDGTGDANSIKLYVNGALAGTGTPGAQSVGAAQNLRIGAPSNVVNFTWDGLIDEVQVFDRVLGPGEIASIFNAGQAGKCKLGACCIGGGTPNTPAECVLKTEEDCGDDLFLGDGSGCEDVDCLPLVVTYDSVVAEAMPQGVRVSWTTSSEIDTVGFRVLRETTVRGEKTIEAVSGLIPSSGHGLQGASYEFLDNSKLARSATHYYVEDVDTFGRTARFGPIPIARTAKPRAAVLPTGK